MKSCLQMVIMLPQRALVLLVTAYRLLLSAWLGTGCRFEPTCSIYSIEALQQHGALRGSYLTFRRLARCQPWCDGGHDPVPPVSRTSLFSRLVTPLTSPPSEKTPS